MLDSELFYLYTNDINYLIGDFGKPVSIQLLRQMTNNSKKLPKTLLFTSSEKELTPIINLLWEISETSFQSKCSISWSLNAWESWSSKLSNLPATLRNLRIGWTRYLFIDSACWSQNKKNRMHQGHQGVRWIRKRIRMDPDISKLIRASEKESQYVRILLVSTRSLAWNRPRKWEKRKRKEKLNTMPWLHQRCNLMQSHLANNLKRSQNLQNSNLSLKANQ